MDTVLLQAQTPQFTAVIIFIAILAAAVVGVVFYQLYVQLVKNGRRRRRTVKARLIRYKRAYGKMNIYDKPRFMGNYPVLMEKHLLVFEEEATGKELTFIVPRDVIEKWKENQEGLLTYRGRRLIHFQTG